MNPIFKLFLITVFLMSFPSKAYGYVDPGSGALLWQMLMAAMVGGLFFIKRGIRFLKTVLERLNLFSKNR